VFGGMKSHIAFKHLSCNASLPVIFLLAIDYHWMALWSVTTSGIDHTSRVLIHQLGADISLLFLYRYGAGYVGWSIDRSHL